MKTKSISKIWFAPIITLAVLSAIYAIAGIYPFGANSTAFSDGINQYVPLLSEFSKKIKEGGSLFYTWNMGAGTNFWSNFTYYLSSPLNLISLFYKPQEAYKAFSLITLLNPCIMALTFGIFLKHRYKKNDLSVVIFSLLWAFSGFMISSCFFTSWYTAIIYFPLVILGLQRMMDGKSAWMYSLFLGLTIVSNFYIGWIVCIFCIIYFIYCFISDEDVVYEGVTAPNENEEEKSDGDSINIFAVFKDSYVLGSLIKFIFASLLGGAISAVFTLPTVYTLQNTAKGLVDSKVFNPSEIWGLLASHVYPMNNIYDTLVSRNVMFCFAGLLSLILCIAYLFSKKISVRKKIGNLFLLAVMWASIVFHAIYFVWHGFGEPAGIMYRFAFVYTFVIIKIAYEMFSESEKISYAGIILSLAFAGAGIAGLYKNEISNAYIWSTALALKIIAFALVYAVMLIIIKNKPSKKQIISIVLTVLTVLEAFTLNTGHVNKTDMTEIYKGRDAVEELLANSDKTDCDTVSLTEKENGFHEMIPYGLSYGYRSLEIYSSMADNNFVLSASNMGAYSNRLNSQNGATETTPVFNLLFPTKYIIDGSGRLTENEFRKKISEKDGYSLYENEFTMPFMYMLSGNIGLWRPFSFPVVADNINEVFKCMTETDGDVAVYNENRNFSFENCEHIATAEKIANQTEQNQLAHEHEHAEGENNDEFWNYLQNKMADFAFRIDDMSKSAYISYESVAQCDGIMYIFVDTTEFTEMKITINGKTVDYYTYGLGENRTYEIGEVKKGDVAKITIGGRKDNSNGYVAKESSFAAIGFTVDMDIFRAGYEKIDAMSDTQMLDFSDTYVKAKVNAYENGGLYIPISYDKGWKVTVDGVPTEIFEHESHIMMLPLSQGEHIIEMKYCPQGFVPGAIITGVSMLILIAWTVISKKRNDKIAACEKSERGVTENDD